VRELGGRVSTEITDATGPGIHSLRQFLRTDPFLVPNPLPMRPVLTEQAVKGAPVIEDGKVFETNFRTETVSIRGIPRSCSARADPIGHTISRKPIIIPTDIAFFDGNALEHPFLTGPQAAITPSSFWDLTTIETNLTVQSKLFTGRPIRQLK
jgi:hypothetical protein